MNKRYFDRLINNLVKNFKGLPDNKVIEELTISQKQTLEPLKLDEKLLIQVKDVEK